MKKISGTGGRFECPIKLEFKRYCDVTESNIIGREVDSSNNNYRLDVVGCGSAAFILFDFTCNSDKYGYLNNSIELKLVLVPNLLVITILIR